MFTKRTFTWTVVNCVHHGIHVEYSFDITVAGDSAVQLLASQILMNFATCGESRPFVLEHDSLLDSLVDGVGEKFGRQAVRAFTLRALVELGTEDKSVVISRVSSRHTL